MCNYFHHCRIFVNSCLQYFLQHPQPRFFMVFLFLYKQASFEMKSAQVICMQMVG